MDKKTLEALLKDYKNGAISTEEMVNSIRHLPFERLEYATVDHHRSLRQGFPEIIQGQGKTAEQIIGIMESLKAAGSNALATRVDADKATSVKKKFDDCQYHQTARILTLTCKPITSQGAGTILVVTAGTSDIPVAEEAAVTARFLGNQVEVIHDVGVAGLHRLLAHHDKLVNANVIIAIAGMEGALPSVIGGLVSRPVIAVPTSNGYGANYQGISALLGMLNSCASGVTVVNIDNGFGAAFAASLINRM